MIDPSRKYIIDSLKNVQHGDTKQKEVIHENLEDDILFYFDEGEHFFVVEYSLNVGIARIKCRQIDQLVYEYIIEADNLEEPRHSTHSKPIPTIGSTKRSDIFKKLDTVIDESDINPKGKGSGERRRSNLLETVHLDLSGLKQLIEERLRAWFQFGMDDQTQSYFDVVGDIDEFTSEVKRIASKLLIESNVIEELVDVLELRVVAQKPQLVLEIVIAGTSLTGQPIHSLIIALPGKSKTTISKNVFEIWPKHHRMKFDRSSKVAGIVNATKYREGSHILDHKLIRLGDFGSKRDQELVSEIIALFKVLMSEVDYDKILTDMQDDQGRPVVLKIRGCGSVHMEIVNPSMEEQFMSRTLAWSPADSKAVQNRIMEFQEDEVARIENEVEFKERREIVACTIDYVYQYVDEMESKGDFIILNPFTSHLNFNLNVKSSPNANRDRMMIQTVPKIITLFNCFQREMYYNERLNRYALVVSTEDYIYVLKTLGKTLSHFIHKKPEVLSTYTTIIEENFLEIAKKSSLKYDSLVDALDELSKTSDIDYLSEDAKTLRDTKHFTTYDEIADYTTTGVDSVREHVKELEKMGIVCIGRHTKPHRIFIPQNYDEQKKKAFSSIFDYEKFLEENKDRLSGLESNQHSLDESEIENLRENFISYMSEHGWRLCSVQHSLRDSILNKEGDNPDGSSNT